MSRVVVLACVVAAGALVASCDRNSPTGPTETLTIVATSSLDGWVTSSGAVQTAAGGPMTGDADALTPGVSFRQFYSFDLSGVPAGAEVELATLRLYQASSAGTPYTSLGNVVVDHVNYGALLTAAAFDQTAIASSIGVLSSNATIEYKTLAVTSAVQDDVSIGRARSQFRLRMSIIGSDNDGTNDSVTFSDAELSCCLGQPPQLVITYR